MSAYQTVIPNRPPPRIVDFEPFADSGTMQCRPAGWLEMAQLKREQAARLIDEARDLEAMAAEAVLTHVE